MVIGFHAQPEEICWKVNQLEQQEGWSRIGLGGVETIDVSSDNPV